MLSDIESFIKYFHGQRRRTQWHIDVLPPAKHNWRPWPNEPTPADMLCKLAASHLMYATVVAHDYWFADEYEAYTVNWDMSLEYFHTRTEQALDLLRPLKDDDLIAPRRRPGNNPPTQAWRFLMAMIDTEISTRTHLNAYLMLMNIRRPQLGGVTIEAVREKLTE